MSLGRRAPIFDERRSSTPITFSSQFYTLFLLQVFIDVTQLGNTAMMMSM
jgi:hypothetical protein